MRSQFFIFDAANSRSLASSPPQGGQPSGGCGGGGWLAGGERGVVLTEETRTGSRLFRLSTVKIRRLIPKFRAAITHSADQARLRPSFPSKVPISRRSQPGSRAAPSVPPFFNPPFAAASLHLLRLSPSLTTPTYSRHHHRQQRCRRLLTT
ncbi:hypothetical protein E2C01_050861 [Portunus trituberculatus]|uniref:Uncharacterized protein n=1 Tax=Portunus trituberculatus TaxID=210409 RepID=A0A5B7GHH0_PORTR|nr:hypothetical protein [Portunus trituberculatus]